MRSLSLTLADLGGVGESIFHTLPDMARNFDTISARPGHERNLMVPYFAAHGRDGVAEGEDCFWIPSGGSRFELSRFGEVVCPERDDGEQSEPEWCEGSPCRTTGAGFRRRDERALPRR